MSRIQFQPRRRPRIAGLVRLACLLVLTAANPDTTAVFAQPPGGFSPIDHRMAPGQAAAWLAQTRQYDPNWLQPMQVELASGGTVSVHSASPVPSATLPSPARFSINPGHFYRLHLSEMPEFPGVDIYPTIELLDHLHPPAGHEEEYPIPVVIDPEDIRAALAGQLVTRIIYLEQPQLAASFDPLRREVPQSVRPGDNALQYADQLGRPMLILRIGSRVQSDLDANPGFFGSGGAVTIPALGQPAPTTVQARPAPTFPPVHIAGVSR